MQEVAEPVNALLYPILWVGSEGEGALKYQIENHYQQREPQPPIGEYGVEPFEVGVVAVVKGLVEGTTNKAVPRFVDKGGRRLVEASLYLAAVAFGRIGEGHIVGGLVEHGEGHLGPFEQADGEVTLGIDVADVRYFCHFVDQIVDGLFNVGAIAHMHMTACVLALFVGGGHTFYHLLHAGSIAGVDGESLHTHQPPEMLIVNRVVGVKEFVIAIEGKHQLEVHVDKLGGEH